MTEPYAGGISSKKSISEIAPADIELLRETISFTSLNSEGEIFQSTHLRCVTPDESCLHVEDDAPLCSTLKSSANEVKLKSTKKIKSGFKLPSSKSRKKSKTQEVQYMPENWHISEKKKGSEFEEEKKKRKLKHKGSKGFVPEKKLPIIGECVNINITADMNTSTTFMAANASKGSRSKHSHKKAKHPKSEKQPLSNTAVFGVPLQTAIDRNPSHDGVPLPAFFRHCIDFIEEYGLDTEGIYRVPGVNSQVTLIINALNNGVEFPNVPPSSPSHPQQSVGSRQQTSAFPFMKSVSKAASASDKLSRLQLSPTTPNLPTCSELTSLPVHDELITSSPPHDPAVVTSVLKHFLRSLPDPVFTNRLTHLAEAACDLNEPITRMRRIGELVHPSSDSSTNDCLPRPNRYLLAWLLQHMLHVIDRAGENKMTLANLSIVLSPTLGISHRLIAVLLSDASAIDTNCLINGIDSIASNSRRQNLITDSCLPHWLFPDAAFAYRPYLPPIALPPTDVATNLEIPDCLSELEEELYKQESLLEYTLKQIMSEKSNPEKEALIWELQHIITKMKRKKSILELSDPALIRVEINRREAQLERLHQELVKTNKENRTSNLGSVSTDRPMHSIIDLFSNSTSTTNDHKVVRPSYSRLPVSQFDFSKRSKVSCVVDVAENAQITADSFTDDRRVIADLDAEVWELQSTVTLLKRRLKLQSRTLKSSITASHLPSLPTCDLLGTQEVFNFTLRKPPSPYDLKKPSTIVEEVDISCLDEVKPLRLKISTEEDVFAEKTIGVSIEPLKDEKLTSVKETVFEIDNFSVDWPAAIEANGTALESQACTNDQLVSENEPNLVDSSVDMTPSRDDIHLSQVSKQPAYVIEYWNGRKQELIGIHNDLNSRIRSQKAEIAHIIASIEHLVAADDKQAHHVRQYYRDNQFLLAPSPLSSLTCQESRSGFLDINFLSHDAAIWSGSDDDCNNDDDNEEEEDDDDDEEDESELASALLQLMRDNQRLEALNESCLERIITERDKCTDLKVLLRLNTCLQSTELSIST